MEIHDTQIIQGVKEFFKEQEFAFLADSQCSKALNPDSGSEVDNLRDTTVSLNANFSF